jgi:hypothetical protein
MSSQLGLFDGPPPQPQPQERRVSFHTQGQPVTVEEASAGDQKARNQETQILAWFKAQRRGARFTPSQVHGVFVSQGWPVTSVRRALTNLSTGEQGAPLPPLEHHPEDRRPGPLGARESTWSLRHP